MLSRWCILSQMFWQWMSAYWERQVQEQQSVGPSQNSNKWLRSSSAPSLTAPLKIVVHILIPAPTPRDQVSSQRKQLCDWKHVEDQGRALRTGSIVKKSWLELNRTDRPHQRNMAVRVALNQSMGQTEKVPRLPCVCPLDPQPALNTFSGVKNPQRSFFPSFSFTISRKQVELYRKWTNIWFLMSH